jgi:hypothetical protein
VFWGTLYCCTVFSPAISRSNKQHPQGSGGSGAQVCVDTMSTQCLYCGFIKQSIEARPGDSQHSVWRAGVAFKAACVTRAAGHRCVDTVLGCEESGNMVQSSAGIQSRGAWSVFTQ